MADPQDPYAAIAQPVQSADPYAAIAKPVEESWWHKTFAPRDPLAAPGAKSFKEGSRELPGSTEGP